MVKSRQPSSALSSFPGSENAKGDLLSGTLAVVLVLGLTSIARLDKDLRIIVLSHLRFIFFPHICFAFACVSSAAIHEFPRDYFTNQERVEGAVGLHVLCVSVTRILVFSYSPQAPHSFILTYF